MGSENSSGGAGAGDVWAHAWAQARAQAWTQAWAQAGAKLGPSWAQAGPKVGAPKKYKNQKFPKSKSVLPKMSARFFLPRKKKLSRAIWGPPGPFFPQVGKIQKLPKFCLFSLVGPWALFTRFGALAAIHPRWGNRYHLGFGRHLVTAPPLPKCHDQMACQACPKSSKFQMACFIWQSVFK